MLQTQVAPAIYSAVILIGSPAQVIGAVGLKIIVGFGFTSIFVDDILFAAPALYAVRLMV